MQFFAKLLFCLLFSASAFAQISRPSTLTLDLNTAESIQKTFVFDLDAFVKLPTSLSAKSTSLIRVKIYFNLNSADYDFHCYYKSVSQIDKLEFEKCETPDGDLLISNVEDLNVYLFPAYKSSLLMMELIESNDRLSQISATFNVDWL